MQARECASCRLKASKLYLQAVYARRSRTVINKGIRQDVLSTKAMKEEKTPFDERIFGTKTGIVKCKSDLFENEAKVENEVLVQG
ncbi:hypothetical protein J1N35_008995 [Gossypium stocksii]|uniref:Uncharacterized protein n=1 Tax=Gossypium stocksii TaxID=47602 RepID=A0A9D4AF05_9ROSI|nr:hypothetical protein J1N35_008995 [Gossypium stocksii]